MREYFSEMEEIKTYADFVSNVSTKHKIRTLARDFTVAAKSVSSKIPVTNSWIRLVYYHHVFDDERKGFEKQIKYMKNYGEFISLDQVVQLINGEEKLSGRYFSMSFDDGIQNNYTNMMPITDAHDVPVIIYLPTDYIGRQDYTSEEKRRIGLKLPENPKQLSYLSWDQCIEMLDHKVTFGSHTASHRKLSTLDAEQIKFELESSKKIIEDNLKQTCEHFAPPNGNINVDFDPEISEKIAREAGYKTLVSATRGITRQTSNLFCLRREHLIGAWGNYQLKYFLSRT